MDIIELLQSFETEPDKSKICPICGLGLVQTLLDTHDQCFVLEEVLECPTDHYIYEYAYGSSREFIGKEELDWYRLSDSDYKEHEAKRQELIEKVKKERNSHNESHPVYYCPICYLELMETISDDGTSPPVFVITHECLTEHYKSKWSQYEER